MGAGLTDDEIIDACKAIVARGTKPTLPEVTPLVESFYKLPGNGADDGNYERRFIRGTYNDPVARALADVLLILSNSQRRRV